MIEKSHQKKKMAIIKKIFKFSELKKFEWWLKQSVMNDQIDYL